MHFVRISCQAERKAKEKSISESVRETSGFHRKVPWI